jgi:hypothetical protein
MARQRRLILEAERLADFQPETIVASGGNRRLTVTTQLDPLFSTLRLYVDGALVDAFDNLQDAVNAFNDA